jgi:hypothetical protein
MHYINRHAIKAVIMTVMVVGLLAACTTETTSQATSAAVDPTVVPTETPIPYQDFANAEIPAPDPERLAQLSSLLSLIPDNFGSAVYLDMEFVRENDILVNLASPEVLGIEVALPSIATGLVNTIAVSADFETETLLTPFQSTFPIEDMLKVGGGFGFDLGGDGPTTYKGHDVWGIDILGTVVAMATADKGVGVAASGRGLTVEDSKALAETSLDAFDGHADSLVNSPGLTELLSTVPSGFAAGVITKCASFPLFAELQADIGCSNVVVSAGILPGDLAVFHAVIKFPASAIATAALPLTSNLVERARQTHEFEDLGVRQEGELLRVRVIVNVGKFSDVFPLFASSN